MTSFLLRCAAEAKFSAHVSVETAASLNTVLNLEEVSSAEAAASMAASQKSLTAPAAFLITATVAATTASFFRLSTRLSPAPAPFLPIFSRSSPVFPASVPRPSVSLCASSRALLRVALMVWMGCRKALPISLATLLVAAPIPLTLLWTLEMAAPIPVRKVLARLSPDLMLSSMALRTLLPIFVPAPDTEWKAEDACVPMSERLVPICSSSSAVRSASSWTCFCFSLSSSRGAVSVPNRTPKDKLRWSAIDTPLTFCSAVPSGA